MTEPAKSEVTETEEVDVSAFDLNIHVHRLLMTSLSSLRFRVGWISAQQTRFQLPG